MDLLERGCIKRMGLISYLKERTKPPKQALTITDNDTEVVEKICSELGLTQRLNGLLIDRFAINVAINLIAGLVSKCEFKTYKLGRPFIGKEYYLWNIEPNVNQNSTQFIQEFIYRLCRYNEALIIEFNGQLIVAESFNKTEYALYETTFSGVTRKGFTFNRTFKMSEVLYFKLNNDDIAKLFSNLYSGYDSLISEAINRYKKGGGEKIILNISSTASGNPDFENKLKQLMNEYFRTYFESKNAVLPLTDGYSADRQTPEQSKKTTSEITDIATLTKEAFERAGQAFKIPPAILRGDIADVEQLTDNLLTFCVDPFCDLVSEEIIRKRFGEDEFIKGNYLKVDTTCIKHIDIFSIAEKIDKLIASGTYNIDEIREKAGDTKLNTEFSKKYWITKNYQDIEKLEGGETNNG